MLRISSKKRALSLLMTLALVVSLLAGLGITANAAPAWSGDGSAATPYLIANATDLDALATAVAAGNLHNGDHFRLTNSFTVSSGWAGIGTPTTALYPSTSSPVVSGYGFAGTFDGYNNTLTIARTASTSSVGGVFNYLAVPGTVYNLNVAGTLTVTGGVDAIGGVVGYNSGTINKVKSSVTVTASNAFNVGGIAGYNNGQYYVNILTAKNQAPKGIIVNSINTGAVTGRTKVGGITGQNSSVINYCSNTGTINSTATSGGVGVGGIVGRNGNNNAAIEEGWVDNCFNRGNIVMAEGRWGGGITGFENALSHTNNCYSTGTVTGYHSFSNTVVGATENPNLTNYANFASNPAGTAQGSDPINYLRGTNPGNMTTVNFASALNARVPTNQYWTWASGTNDDYPYHTRLAPVPQPHGVIEPNSLQVVYVKTGGSDNNDGSYSRPVATLGRAAVVASMSDYAGVYISVENTLTISNSQSAFANYTPGVSSIAVKWNGQTGPMFTISGTGSLTVGGLQINGMGVATVFDVESGGNLALRNNAAITNCTTAIEVAAGGNLTLNQSSIGGTTSIELANSTSICRIFAASGQTVSISGIVDLNGSNINSARLTLDSALTGTVNIDPSQTASGRVVAVAATNAIAQASVSHLVLAGNTLDVVDTEIRIH